MPNDWFQFKQFRIEQDRCGMKVSTDACIQGSWAAAFLKENTRFHTALDIGTGTGLLSLMLLQKSPELIITALEKEPEAAAQAKENFAAAPWKNSTILIPESLESWMREQQKNGVHPLFDFIISNPPFFEHQLSAAEAGRSMARHDALSARQLAEAMALLLNPAGVCCMMYPEREWTHWEVCAAAEGLYPFRLLQVQPYAEKEPNRIIGLFSTHKPGSRISEELTIYKAPGQYTVACSDLLKDYYLNL